jgi:hypothetical protein
MDVGPLHCSEWPTLRQGHQNLNLIQPATSTAFPFWRYEMRIGYRLPDMYDGTYKRSDYAP